MIICWKNKYSNESGYVESVSRKERHFNNTFDKAEAKVYKTKEAAQKIIELLVSFGEGDNNDFEIVAV